MRTNTKPKILSFSHYGTLYGANRSLLTLLIATRDQIDWWVICLEDGDFVKELAQNGIEYKVLNFANDIHKVPRYPQWFHSIKRFAFNVAAAIYIAGLVIKKRIDLIHTNSSVIFFGALVAFFSRRKHLWHIREFVYEDYHLQYNFGKSSFRFWANKAARIICISKSIAEKRVIEAGVTAPHVVIYNGLVDSLPASRSHLPGEIPLAGIVGIIDPAKGQMTAVKAMNVLIKKGVPVKLEVVGEIGDPAYYEQIAAYIREQGIGEQITFTGFTKDIQSIYRRLDVLLMCSPNEALGRVTIEGMMYGVPVVAFDSAGTTEIVQHEKTGLLYRSDENSLAIELDRLIHDHSLYTGIAERAREHVSENFTVTKYRDNFVREVENCRKIWVMHYPKISIITVVRNGEKDLESAIKSVVNQTYPHIEFIILDGLSTDGTLDIIRKYEDQIACWKSEADCGIFDAMNKGLDLATGDWVYFLGCDDVLASPTIIEEVAIEFTIPDGIYYGNTYLKKSNQIYTGKVSRWTIALRNISHQAIFYPKSIYKQKKYNLDYKLTADHIYNLELYSRFAGHFIYMPVLISIYNDLGMSSLNVDQRHKKDIVGIVFDNLGGAVGSYYWFRVKLSNFKNSLKGGK